MTWSVALLSSILAGRAEAIPVFTVTPNPPFASVLEGLPGVFDFTVKNTGQEEFTISDVRLPGNSVTLSIQFEGGDANDEVFNTALALESQCEGKTLALNETCVFQQTFQTRDNNPAASGTNVGLWTIANVVQLTVPITTLQPKTTEVRVEVRDPGAPSTIPVPPALVLLGSGLAALGAVQFKRGKKANSAAT